MVAEDEAGERDVVVVDDVVGVGVVLVLLLLLPPLTGRVVDVRVAVVVVPVLDEVVGLAALVVLVDGVVVVAPVVEVVVVVAGAELEGAVRVVPVGAVWPRRKVVVVLVVPPRFPAFDAPVPPMPMPILAAQLRKASWTLPTAAVMVFLAVLAVLLLYRDCSNRARSNKTMSTSTTCVRILGFAPSLPEGDVDAFTCMKQEGDRPIVVAVVGRFELGLNTYGEEAGAGGDKTSELGLT